MRAMRLSGHNPASCSRLRIVEEDHMSQDSIITWHNDFVIAENPDYSACETLA